MSERQCSGRGGSVRLALLSQAVRELAEFQGRRCPRLPRLEDAADTPLCCALLCIRGRGSGRR
eukprot:710867-Pyramimonas_sp.AAC.1